MKRSLFILLLTASLAVSMAVDAREVTVRLGIVLDGPWVRSSLYREKFLEEIRSTTAGEVDLVLDEADILDGGWSVEKINASLDRLLADSSVDLVIMMGKVGSNEACRRRKLSKPVIATSILDTSFEHIPVKDGTSGVRNLNYITSFRSIGSSVMAFREITPFDELIVLVDAAEFRSIPESGAFVGQIEEDTGVRIIVVEVDGSAEQALLEIPPDAEAVMMMFQPRLTDLQFADLVAGLNGRNLPTFTISGREEVEAGILAGLSAQESHMQLARGVAINIMDIARGTDAGTLPVSFTIDEKLVINMATARLIDVYPGYEMITGAELINERAADTGRVLTIETAISEALAANLDLAAADRYIAGGAQQVNEARAALLPWIGLRTDYSVIDEDRAEALGGMMPEKLWTGTAGLSQLIYSDRAWAGYTVEKHLQESRVQDVEATRLDIIQAAATAYLRVLKALTIEQIQKENLVLTRENLARARIRVSAGIAGPDEVYRWEAEIATSKGAVLQAESGTMAARAEMNRILNRPLMEEFMPGEGYETAVDEILVDDWVVDYLQNPRTLRQLGEILLEDAIINAPEIKGVDALIAAAERTLSGSKRNFFIPDLSVNGDVTQRFDYSGAGSERPPGSTVDDTAWSVGATASIPLLTGGERIATLNRTKEELARVRIERGALSQRVEQRTLNDVYMIRASYPAIGLSKSAVEASEKNLDLVSESYAQGIKSIIDLIDAQNKYYVAKQSEANAAFGFAADLISLQRSIGKFYMLLGEGERENFRDKVEAKE